MDRVKEIQELIKDTIQRAGHHPYLFVGSGFSKRYMGYEKWDELLRRFCVEFSGDEFLYDSYASQVKNEDYYGKQPKIATLLERDYNTAVFKEEKYKVFLQNHKELIQRGVSPFKIAVAEHFRECDLDMDNEEIQLLKQIAVRSISGIITTNYDFILEKIFQGYDTYVGQEEMLFANISGIGEIYKIHGSASKPESIVITAEDYKFFEDKSAYLIAKLLTMFLEYPVIFMGYSLQDRNINNILRTISDCLSQEQLKKLKDQLIFVNFGMPEAVSERTITFENGRMVFMNEITTEKFSLIYEAIGEIKSRYSPRVLRDLRKDIYKLANNSNAKSTIYATGIENLDRIEEGQQFVLGVGVQKSGHIVKAEQIYEDIVFDNQYFNPSYVVEEYLPELLKSNSGGLPMYKYLKDYERKLYERVRENILKRNTIDSFLNQQLRAQKSNYRKDKDFLSVNNVIETEGEQNAYKRLVFLEKEEINLEDMKKYLQKLLKPNAKEILKNNSELKRLIRIYDFVKYGQNMKISQLTFPNSANT